MGYQTYIHTQKKMFWLLVGIMSISSAVSQCTFDDRLLEKSTRNALKDSWPKFEKRSGKTMVPVLYTRKVTSSTRLLMKLIYKRIEKRMDFSCPIQFEIGKNWIRGRTTLLVHQKSAGCGSKSVGGSVGRLTRHLITLTMSVSPCQNNRKTWKKVALHELFHVFGIAHTQRRVDRDNYITVIQDNIQEKFRRQYDICYGCTIVPLVAYECNSIMHYSDSTFSISPGHKPTMKSANKQSCPAWQLIFGSYTGTTNDWNSLKFALGCCVYSFD